MTLSPNLPVIFLLSPITLSPFLLILAFNGQAQLFLDDTKSQFFKPAPESLPLLKTYPESYVQLAANPCNVLLSEMMSCGTSKYDQGFPPCFCS